MLMRGLVVGLGAGGSGHLASPIPSPNCMSREPPNQKYMVILAKAFLLLTALPATNAVFTRKDKRDTHCYLVYTRGG